MKGFKKCSNGHWYKNDLSQCPYCQGKESSQGSNTATFPMGGNVGSTQDFHEFGNEDSNKTEIMQGGKNPLKGVSSRKASMAISNKTVYEDEFEEETEQGSVVIKKERRTNRRLVGWIVTYSIDPLGIDYKIYEGRNVIGQDMDCNITVSDKKISGKHAVILFRADQYMIQDQLSTHGTFVNDEDIKFEPFELNDGDIIQMGDTIFKFKTSL